MSDTFWIAVVVGITIVLVIFILQHRLRDFAFGSGKNGLHANLTTHPPDSTSGPAVRRNWMFGKKQKIQATGTGVVDDNVLLGGESEAGAGENKPPAPRKLPRT